MNKKKALKKSLLFVLLTLVSVQSFAYCGGPNIFLGFGGPGVFFGNGGYYGPGPFYNLGWWAPAPTIIVNTPPPPPVYVVECETIQVCDDAVDECWLERRCN